MICTKVAGQITICAAMASTATKTVQFIADSGFKVKCMAKAKRPGLKALSITVTMRMVESKAKVLICGPMVAATTESGARTRFMVMVQSTGKMVDLTRESGRRATCTASASISGVTIGSTRVNTVTTRSMDMASMSGLMVASTKATGKMVSSTVSPSMS